MTNDVLQRFLTRRLFDVAGDDARLTRMREAAEDVAGLLRAAPHRLPAFTMVAIDAEVPPDEPALAEVAGILEGRWNSYAGAFADSTLRTVFRAIILQALSKLVSTEQFAPAIAMTARNMLPRIGSLPDRELWGELLADADRMLERQARLAWSVPDGSLPELTPPTLPSISPPIVNVDWLKKRLADATSANDEDETGTKSNPNLPSAGAAWTTFFAKSAGVSIGMSIDTSIKKLADAINEQAAPAAFMKAAADHIQAVTSELERRSSALERRSSLLWWKAAMYSPAADRAYRSLDPVVVAALVAIDVSSVTGPLAPRMAESFLLEAVRSLDPESMSTERPLVELCASLGDTDAEAVDVARNSFATAHMEGGRTTLASLLGAGVTLDDESVSRRLGLPGGVIETPAGLCLWLFRDLQAQAALPVPAKVTSRKKRSAAS